MEIDKKTKQPIVPKLEKDFDKSVTPEEKDFEQTKNKPIFITRTSVALDLSGAAATAIALHTEIEAEIVRAFLLYTEASSADAGIAIKVGKETDDDYYFTGTSEVSKALWYTKKLTLLKKDIIRGDTIILSSAGGKTGTGEVILIIEYKIKGVYRGE